MIKEIIKKIFTKKSLSIKESYLLFKNFIKRDISDIELAGCLIAMKIKGETKEEICGAVNAFLEKKIHFQKPNFPFLDVVGTGGDNANTINISTISSLIAAYCGVKIIKHCNTGVSSTCGSSDILQMLGIKINIDPIAAKKMLKKFNICFLPATKYHPGFKYASTVRKHLKTRTIFNIIGPLLNPAEPKRIVIGVYNKKLTKIIAETLVKMKYEKAFVIYGNGMDEISISSDTNVAEINNGKISYYNLNPEIFGFKPFKKKDITINSLEEIFDTTKKILKGEGKKCYEYLIAMNTSILLKINGENNLKDNARYILDIIRSGKIYQFINSFYL
ncbi:Anthranilate phosphoribosyltransferase [Buchnera aphidicola (Neophyllaphis podocarpi)]|uniref:anthranilate phosphoribosyltransferase n=1 Tax=Buchnera aphidicola TaxID=9 RepID=UPI0034646498